MQGEQTQPQSCHFLSTEHGLCFPNDGWCDKVGNNGFVKKLSKRSGLFLVHFSPFCPTAPEEVSQNGNQIKAASRRMSIIHTCLWCRGDSCSQPASPARGRDCLPCPISCGQTEGNTPYIIYETPHLMCRCKSSLLGSTNGYLQTPRTYREGKKALSKVGEVAHLNTAYCI